MPSTFKTLFIGIVVFVLAITNMCFADDILKWDSAGEVSGYKIYYGTSQGNYPNSVDVGNVDQYSMLKLPLENGIRYYFVVRAYIDDGESGNSNALSYIIGSPVDTTPPFMPQGVTAEVKAENVILKWQENTEIDLSEYRIHYGLSSREYGLPISVGNIDTYTISGLETGKTYYCAVTAIDASENESGISDEVIVTIPSEIIDPSPADIINIGNEIVGAPRHKSSGSQVLAYKLETVPSQSGLLKSISFSLIGYDPKRMRFALYTHDALNDLPDAMVPNSLTVEGTVHSEELQLITLFIEKDAPQIIEGTQYWLLLQSQDNWLMHGAKWSPNAKIALKTKDVGTYNWGAWNGTATSTEPYRLGACYFSYVVDDTSEIDTTPPSISINIPTTDATFDTLFPNLDIKGIAADSVGVTQVSWSNFRGGSGTAAGTDNWSVAGIALSEGDNVITITAQDKAGNTSTDVLTVTYTVPDTTVPSVSISSPTTGTAFDTLSSSVNISGVASDNKSVIQVVWFNSTGGSGTATGTDTWKADGIILVEGRNVITITARDAAGNESTDVLTVTYTIPDTTAPSVTISSPTANAAFATLSSSVNIGGVASDNKGVTQVVWSSSTGGNGNATGTETWSTGDIGLIEGNNIIIVIARDAAGNESTDTITVTYTIPDTIAPSVSISSPSSGASFNTSSPRVDIGGTASDNKGVTRVTWSNSRGGSGMASGTDNWSAAGIDLTEGSNVITITARDAAGNESKDVITVVYAVADTQAPSLTVNQPTTGGFYFTRSATVNIAGSASDNIGVKQVTWSNSTGGSGVASGTTNWSASAVDVAVWWNTITVTVVDDAGNETSREFTVFSWR